MSAHQLIDLVITAMALATLLLPFTVAALIMCVRRMLGAMQDCRAAEHEADRLKRRLRDVEAIRKTDGAG